jgi:ferredoxin
MSDSRKYRALIDSRLCVGTSNCAEAAPSAYEMDDRSAPHPLAGASDDGLLAGAEACPVGAIRVVDSTTGQQVYP